MQGGEVSRQVTKLKFEARSEGGGEAEGARQEYDN